MGRLTSAQPRAYLLGEDGNYVMLKLLDQEISFDVDLSNLPCGENGALYLSEMDTTGGRNKYNTAGAYYGSGYCDAQCPTLTWRNGTLNTANQGSCCSEMDIMEANSMASSFSPHPCSSAGCTKKGCNFNPYAKGNTTYYGPGLTVDTTQPFTLITRFVAVNESLNQIVRRYVQNGKLISSSSITGDIISADHCAEADPFGGISGLGEAIQRGMVLVFSLWNDPGSYMNWLDNGKNGPCSDTEGDPDNIQSRHADTYVVFSNIRWGDIGSTVKAFSSS
jgi:cellulase